MPARRLHAALIFFYQNISPSMHFYYLIAIIYVILAAYYFKSGEPSVPMVLYIAVGAVYVYAARQEEARLAAK
jgi:hypothetical protein